ncbi:hypothetical protein Natpe_2441 [Natrinema pellirubrum DSM 15624]|nr:hypothetical protein [Natrinema pellirubrum]AGB32257.1 hypothetical protein Natpe_2441 [Natrinema pellirubrum DSM 15624]
MRSRSTGVLTSAVLAFAVGYVLWPPGYVYWTRVADVLGEPLTLALVALLAAVGGAVATLRLAVPLADLVAGSVLAYAVGMALLESVITADSPVHFLLYGGLVLWYWLGATVAAVGRSSRDDRAVSSGRPE